MLFHFIPNQVLVYLGKGRLPWQGIKATNKKQRYERICEVKMRTRPSVSIIAKLEVLGAQSTF